MDSLSGKRLVIFGCGYVGTAVATSASTAGLRVTALTRNAAAAVVLREAGIESVVADLATTTWHDKVASEPEFVLNCVSSGGGDTEAYRHSYVGGMESLVAWTRSHGPVGTLVYTSSTSVYPQGEGAVVDETVPAIAATDRAQILLQAEAVLRSSPDAMRRWFVLRLAGIYGPGRHHLLEQVRAGEVAGKGEYRLNLIHRDDIVSAIMRCFGAQETIRDEVFNLADDGVAQKSEVVTWLATQLGLAAPRWTGAAAGTRRVLTPDRVISNAKAKAMLAWRPRYPTFREGYANLLSR
jgi:nucleoside-diphosphate-sugar epimerase